MPILLYMAATCALILPADFSTAALLAFVCFLLMVIAGVPARNLGIIVGIGFGGAARHPLSGRIGPGPVSALQHLGGTGHRILRR